MRISWTGARTSASREGDESSANATGEQALKPLGQILKRISDFAQLLRFNIPIKYAAQASKAKNIIVIARRKIILVAVIFVMCAISTGIAETSLLTETFTYVSLSAFFIISLMPSLWLLYKSRIFDIAGTILLLVLLSLTYLFGGTDSSSSPGFVRYRLHDVLIWIPIIIASAIISLNVARYLIDNTRNWKFTLIFVAQFGFSIGTVALWGKYSTFGNVNISYDWRIGEQFPILGDILSGKIIITMVALLSLIAIFMYRLFSERQHILDDIRTVFRNNYAPFPSFGIESDAKIDSTLVDEENILNVIKMVAKIPIVIGAEFIRICVEVWHFCRWFANSIIKTLLLVLKKLAAHMIEKLLRSVAVLFNKKIVVLTLYTFLMFSLPIWCFGFYWYVKSKVLQVLTTEMDDIFTAAWEKYEIISLIPIVISLSIGSVVAWIIMFFTALILKNDKDKISSRQIFEPAVFMFRTTAYATMYWIIFFLMYHSIGGGEIYASYIKPDLIIGIAILSVLSVAAMIGKRRNAGSIIATHF